VWQHCHTTASPEAPEVDQDDPALVVGELEVDALGVGRLEVGALRADEQVVEREAQRRGSLDVVLAFAVLDVLEAGQPVEGLLRALDARVADLAALLAVACTERCGDLSAIVPRASTACSWDEAGVP
jgi:hypothetical protein